MDNNQDKSFEKKLQSLSAGFELKPAADGWNKIEAQLPIKKKGRFIFLLIPVGIAISLVGAFVFSNSDLISDSHIIQEGHPERIRRNAEGANSSNSKPQNNTVSFEAAKTNNSDILNQSIKNKNASAIAATSNSFSSSDLSRKSNQNKNQKSHGYNNTSNNVIEVENNEQLNSESLIAIKENEMTNEELIRMAIINPTLMTNNNQSPVGINFQQILQTGKQLRWSVGITYLPMFTNRKVSYNLGNSNPVFIDDTSYKKRDEYLFSNNFGLDVYYSITSKWYLHSGLYFITYGEKSFHDNKVYQNTIANPLNILDYANYNIPGSEQQRTNKYSFIQLPFNVGLNIRAGRKTSFNIEPGLSYGYLVKTNALEYKNINDTIQLNALDDAQLNRMNRNILFANASISFDWRFIKNISWRNGFTAQYQLADLYRKDEIQSQHNYGFGLHTSLIFNFK